MRGQDKCFADCLGIEREFEGRTLIDGKDCWEFRMVYFLYCPNHWDSYSQVSGTGVPGVETVVPRRWEFLSFVPSGW